jgi:hypothetical protein
LKVQLEKQKITTYLKIGKLAEPATEFANPEARTTQTQKTHQHYARHRSRHFAPDPHPQARHLTSELGDGKRKRGVLTHRL